MEGVSPIVLTKAQRINLTNRRTVAFILEMIPVNVVLCQNWIGGNERDIGRFPSVHTG